MNVRQFCIPEGQSIRDAVARMTRKHSGILLIVDKRRRLLGTITDGDIRRAALARIDMSLPIRILLKKKKGTRYARPITAPDDADPQTYLKILKKYGLFHLPLVDKQLRVTDLALLDDFVDDQPLGLKAVVMAGGKGKRLRPLTKKTPKPMLRVGDRPLMETILRQLKSAGIRQVHVTTHFQPQKITRHFGNGKTLGLNLDYVQEDRPLGTAGALSLLKRPRETMLVINGDILTQVDIRAMLAFHREERADMTVAVRHYGIKVPFGVVTSEGARVKDIAEKPNLDFFVSAGIYLIEPSLHRYIPSGRRYDMTDLIRRAVKRRRRVVSFPIHEYWIDIGQPADLRAAKRKARTWKKPGPKRRIKGSR